MSERKGALTNKDHNDLDSFFERVLDLHKSRKASSKDLIATIGQVVGAIDIENLGEVRAWTANPGNLEYQYPKQ